MDDKKKKFPRESFVSMTELVLPNDTNTLNNLMGGRLMHWMDIVSAISAALRGITAVNGSSAMVRVSDQRWAQGADTQGALVMALFTVRASVLL